MSEPKLRQMKNHPSTRPQASSPGTDDEETVLSVRWLFQEGLITALLEAGLLFSVRLFHLPQLLLCPVSVCRSVVTVGGWDVVFWEQPLGVSS